MNEVSFMYLRNNMWQKKYISNCDKRRIENIGHNFLQIRDRKEREIEENEEPEQYEVFRKINLADTELRLVGQSRGLELDSSANNEESDENDKNCILFSDKKGHLISLTDFNKEPKKWDLSQGKDNYHLTSLCSSGCNVITSVYSGGMKNQSNVLCLPDIRKTDGVIIEKIGQCDSRIGYVNYCPKFVAGQDMVIAFDNNGRMFSFLKCSDGWETFEFRSYAQIFRKRGIQYNRMAYTIDSIYPKRSMVAYGYADGAVSAMIKTNGSWERKRVAEKNCLCVTAVKVLNRDGFYIVFGNSSGELYFSRYDNDGFINQMIWRHGVEISSIAQLGSGDVIFGDINGKIYQVCGQECNKIKVKYLGQQKNNNGKAEKVLSLGFDMSLSGKLNIISTNSSGDANFWQEKENNN